MKTNKLLILAALFLTVISQQVYSQGVAINCDNSNPDTSAILDVKSTTMGLLIPRMTIIERNMINKPKHSLLIYQTDGIEGYYYNEGTQLSPDWVKISIETDNIYSAGNQLSLSSNTFSVIEGHNSDLDADLLDGYHYSDIIDSVLWQDKGLFMQPKSDIGDRIRIAQDSTYKYGFYSDISSSSTEVYGAYLKSYSNNLNSYGLYAQTDYNGAVNTNKSYGAYVQSNSTARDNTAIYAKANISSTTAIGILEGVSLDLLHEGEGSLYGLHSEVYSNHTTNANDVYGVYSNARRWRTNQNGNVYGTYSKADEGEFAYGVYSQATDADTNYGIYSTAYGGQANYAGFFNGDVEVTEDLNVDGYITAGNATETTITRYGSQDFTYDNFYAFDSDGYRYITLAGIDFPSGVGSVNIKSIRWECDAMHDDGNEVHGIWVGMGSSSATTLFYGFLGATTNGPKYIDWNYVEDDLNLNIIPSENYLMIRLRDEDGTLKGDDYLRLYNMHIVITYSYSLSLRDGDIAASGRVYANNNTAIGDLAEHFEYKDEVVTGYIVSYQEDSDNNYVKCNQEYSNHITGVISENPSVVLNSSSVGPAVALAGRVKVKLVDSDTLVKGGDFITSSNQAGLGQIANDAGPVIGYAVKDQKEGEDFVEILLQLGKYYIPKDVEWKLQKENNKTEKQVDKGVKE